MNEEQFKQILLNCMKDEEFMCKLRGILSKSGEFADLISDVNDDIDRAERDRQNPY